MAGLLTSALDTVRGYAGSIAWDPLVSRSRTAVLTLFRRLDVGLLMVREKDGTDTVCGRSSSPDGAMGPYTTLTIRREAFWIRLALFADMVRRACSCHRSRNPAH